ncbi:acyl-CoA dehydrogenase family protein [Peterkaempfera bronchialis]|uniref:Acyl-CoA dehydrogenase n=1 Tax=Peterkaempfera bronchialis TaxID=2126346 RepID=A0A345SR18_9ACTN|nr:acyl-CoA dehydrogenase family protein [Peterkaempfera bronchialis]AXI76173.1 acyl-CoA dehydrogenase [Peterkaempfera bronchialis]
MDIVYPPEAEEFRAYVRQVLAEELPADWAGVGAIADRAEALAFYESWRAVLARRGLLGVTWPVEYGGAGLSALHQVVVAEELTRAGAPTGGISDMVSIKMIGNILLLWGTEEQKKHFVPRILSNEHIWCQGFSEPEAGSDLAGLRTRAVLDGDEWVINGQKIWTSQAHRANWIFVLARTDPDASKHRGISFLLVPVDQPGVQVRPIRTMNGDSDFCEVFFDNARTAADLVLGPVNGGWKVAKSLLGFERGEEASTMPILFRAELDRLIELAQERGVAQDPVIRQRLAWCHCRVEAMRHLGYRVLTQYLKGGTPGPESSVLKLFWSEYHQAVTSLALEILGPDALAPEGRGPLRTLRTDDPGVPPGSTGSWTGTYLNARAGTIYAGASEVQRNILAETVLGLPREPAVA